MTRIGRARTAAYFLAALAIAATSCGGGGGVDATLKDFEIDLGETSATAGEVTFSIQNDGPSAHEFVVFKTDLAPDALPTVEDENGLELVDEEGAGASLELVDEAEDIAPDSSTDLTVTLDAGSYVIICNIPSHYQQGMHASFTAN
jgi:uncharacterized cupredoxin-like copper-binding protein